jgi:hypothetical protein
MFGNVTYQMLDTVAKSKREQDVREAAECYRSRQSARRQNESVKTSVPEENLQRGSGILRLLKNLNQV